jgi:acyl-coenzyme A synthetase/AMP-(fatty) acid ligase
MDNDGFLYFVSRVDDIIKSRGEKVSPKEVENVLYSMRGVLEVAVIGVPDPILGEAVKAFVVVDGEDFDENTILAHCKAHLEDFLVPKYLEICSELPKTASGKIHKTGLT